MGSHSSESVWFIPVAWQALTCVGCYESPLGTLSGNFRDCTWFISHGFTYCGLSLAPGDIFGFVLLYYFVFIANFFIANFINKKFYCEDYDYTAFASTTYLSSSLPSRFLSIINHFFYSTMKTIRWRANGNLSPTSLQPLLIVFFFGLFFLFLFYY